jgi:hypothetical protein
MALRFPLRRARPAEPVTVPATVPAVAPAPPLTARVLNPFQKAWQGVRAALSALDYAFSWLAVPFGVWVRNPGTRYALLLGSFALIYILGALPAGYLSLAALGYGYLGVLAIGRAWVLNEKERTAIARKLKDGNPDAMPDLRWTALVAALQLLILFPLLFMQTQRLFHLFRVDGSAGFADWFWFAIDKTYLKALPDWSILYGVHISSIDFDAPWGRHLVLLSRLTFDYILIQGVLRLLAIRATIGEAVAAVKADPEMAVRLGRRAIGPLLEKLRDPDKAVRGAAANALTQLGDSHAIRRISEAVPG